MPRIFLLSLCCLAISACAIPAFSPNETDIETLEISGQTMGTTYSVKIVTIAPKEKKRHEECNKITLRGICVPLIQQTLDEINERMSTYKSDSDVSRFNASESLDWFAVSPLTVEVVARGQLIAEKTGGAFDMTCAPLVALWGFGAAAKKNVSEKFLENHEQSLFAIPTDEEVQAVRARVGYEKLEVQLSPPALKKSIPSLTIDLSAIAKGFAVDEVARRLRELGQYNFMVEVGGEVYCGGSRIPFECLNPNNMHKDDLSFVWRIGIKSPRTLDEPQELHCVQYLYDAALATSGDYHNYIASADGTFSHIIDPRTGYPTEFMRDATSQTSSSQSSLSRERLGSVSVIHKNCTTADAFATALFVLGEEAGMAFAEQEKLQVLMLLRRAAPNAVVRERKNMPYNKEKNL